MGEKISIREFARRVGVSDVAVGKAITAGKIVEGIDYTNPKRPKIDPEIALREWGKNYDPSYQRTDKVNENMGEGVEPPKPATSKPNPPKPPKAYESDNEAPQQPGGKSLAEIKRQAAEVKLHISAIILKEKKGQLVDKDKVYRALFSAGQEVRTAFQAIPDRVIDDILASKTRNEAHSVLFNAIADTLDLLSEVANRDLNL
jgi:hypothetical protein